MIAAQKRLRFVGVLSTLATIYGGILAYRLLNYQDDVVSDILKMCGLIFICAVVLSYFWWTVITPKVLGASGGSLAALMTALCIIPIPTFAGAFKGVYLTHHNVMNAFNSGLKYSLSTFSAAEALALPLCAIAGYILAR